MIKQTVHTYGEEPKDKSRHLQSNYFNTPPHSNDVILRGKRVKQTSTKDMSQFNFGGMMVWAANEKNARA